MRISFVSVLCLALAFTQAHAEDGHDAWLRYAPLPASVARDYESLPSHILFTQQSPVDLSAANELARGLTAMLGRSFTASAATPDNTRNSILLARVDHPEANNAVPAGSFSFVRSSHGFVILAPDANGLLYGAFRLLEIVGTERPLPTQPLIEHPAAPIRWVNQWDNFDGSIERGYAGRSIFFDNGHVRADLTRVNEYARLLASIGINGITVNNVNANPQTLSTPMLHEIARIADAMRPWGVRISLSIPFDSPKLVGGLTTSDPLNPQVIAFWQAKVNEIYTLIPDFAGFLVKADSEGQPGPHEYDRTPADYANMLARALAPHHGLVLYRAFVYNHHLDYNDLKADRAKAAYDNFHPLDGDFLPNVVLQIKEGPIDFQVREPVNPLFAGLHHTSEAIETETTQEYTGQQRHMVFLVPMWKWVLDTDMRAENRYSPVKEIVEGKTFHQPLGGFVSVVNVGLDTNWLHHPMALANLYGFGRLAWNPNLSAQQIVDTWTRLTWGNNPKVDSTIDALQLESWHAFEQYSGPMGLGSLTNILGPHYGPGVASAEYNGWGQWFRATPTGVGMDRTVATGTGYIGQYPPELAAIYESLKTCPDDLLLFMHHVPYTYKLHMGDTVIQHLYNTHYEGAATAATYAPRWQTLNGLIDPERYNKVLTLFTYQAGHAIVWRDAVNMWFYRESGIPDALGRVGHYPNRIEAETLAAAEPNSGYSVVAVTPAEDASGGKAVICNKPTCTLTMTLDKPAGLYRIAVQYFDLRNGVSQYDLLLDGKPIAHWSADDQLPPDRMDTHLDGDTSTRFTTQPIALKPSETLTLRATPNGGEPAPVDYIAIIPANTP